MGLLKCKHHEKRFGITKIDEFSKIVVDNQENADVDYGKRQKFYEQFWYDEF